MAEQWIDAATARRLVAVTQDGTSGTEALCRRLEAGLIPARAKLLVMGEESRSKDAQVIPRAFWLTGGSVDFEQDWDRGDFRTWIGNSRWQAFGVTFGLSGVLEMLPFEQGAIVSRRMSVVSDLAWVTAREARRFAYDRAGVSITGSGTAILDYARLGFVTARAVLAQRFERTRGGAGPVSQTASWEEREWDVPVSFWREFTTKGMSHQDWERGLFDGGGPGPRGPCVIRLEGVHFLTESLQSLLPAAATASPTEEVPSEAPAKDNPGGRPTAEWWDDLWCHVTGQIYAGALTPNSQKVIEEAMHTWANARGHEPAVSTIRLRARRLYRVLKEVENSLDG